jgi:pimeloyl-ACP methyl ester carboxylesterase
MRLTSKLRPLPALKGLARGVLRARGMRSRWVDTEAGRIHVFDGKGQGSLPPFVVLHGISSEATAFTPFLQYLQKSASRVSAPDLLGHGDSDLPAKPLEPHTLFEVMTSALDALIDEPAVVCGNSLGGALALGYAVARPEKVRALVMCSPAAALTTEADLAEVRATFDLKSKEDAKVFFGKLYHRMPWFMPIMARDYVEVTSGRAVRELLAGASIEHMAKPEQLAGLSMPVLLIWGRSERILPASGIGYLRQHLPPSAVIEEPYGFGHCPHLDNPRRLADRVLQFVSTLPA